MPSRRIFLVTAGAFATTACSSLSEPALPYQNEKLGTEKRVRDLLGRMNPEEKRALLRSVSVRATPGKTQANAALGIPSIHVAKSPLPGIALAATWNPDLAVMEARTAARDALAQGQDQILGPCVGDYGEDPWLASRITVACVSALQGEGLIATVGRLPAANTPDDDRTLQEIRLPAFEAAVEEAGVWAVVAPDENQPLLSGILRERWGFKGFAVYESGRPGQAAATPNDDVRPILRAMFASGLFDRKRAPGVKRDDAEHQVLIRSVGLQSIVLLRNTAALLPFLKDKIRTLAVIGRNDRGIRERAGAAFQVSYPSGAGAGAASDSLAVARHSDAVILFAGQDRALMDAVLQANPRTVLILQGSNLPNTSIDAAAAVLVEWTPGPALTDILFGDANPSGKLPVTMAQRPEPPSSEGIYTGYRYFDRHRITPLFPFGHGLSYTSFVYSDLKIYPNTPRYGQQIEIMFKLTNSGKRAGAEVAQVYVHDVKCSVDRPVQELKGFKRVELGPGETKDIMIPLDQRALSFYDPAVKEWATEPGEFDIIVGSSSRDVRLKGGFELFK